MSRYSVDANFDKVNQKNPYEDDMLSDGAWTNLAKSLTDLLSADGDALVISIEAPWGSGKTHFLRRLFVALNGVQASNKLRPIWINAWAGDYISDPFGALIYYFSTAFPNCAASKNFKKSAEIVLKNVITGITDQVFEKAVGSKISTGDIMKKKDEKGAFEKLMKHFDELEKGKEDLARVMNDTLRESNEIAVIIVDELDRCHPHYAIEFLERVKHFFSIPRLKFIFGIDHEQMCHFVRGFFGSGIDSVNYLNRFFNIRINLPVKGGGAVQRILLEKFIALSSSDGVPYDPSPEVLYLARFIDQLPLSIRQKKLLIGKISLAVRYYPNIEGIEFCPLALVLYLNEKIEGFLKIIFSEHLEDSERLLDVIPILLVHTKPFDRQDETDLDNNCIPLFLVMLVGVPRAIELLAQWESSPPHPSAEKVKNRDRIRTWFKQIQGIGGSWHYRRLDRQRVTFARAASLCSTFRL